jgi:DNA-binding NtrC family response regulator
MRMCPVSGRTIYIIDDDDAIRDSLTLVIESEGYAVRAFASCADFLRHARPVDGSCVVVDLEIRDTSGFELVEELQRGNSLVSAIVTTGARDGRMARAARRLDAMRGRSFAPPRKCDRKDDKAIVVAARRLSMHAAAGCCPSEAG